jgi:hypothetical protein
MGAGTRVLELVVPCRLFVREEAGLGELASPNCGRSGRFPVLILASGGGQVVVDVVERRRRLNPKRRRGSGA